MYTITFREMNPSGAMTAIVRFICHSIQTRALLGALFVVSLAIPTNTFGQTTWQGGTGNWGDSSNWSAGLPNSTTNVFIDGDNGTNSIVNVNVLASANDLTIDLGDTVSINNTQRLSIHGTLFNNGTLIVNSTGSNTYLQPVGTITFAGNGAVELMGNNAWLYDQSNSNNASDHLINSASHTIRGVGNIGFSNTLQITNHGLIHANVAGGTLNVTPNESGMINTGIMRASNGGNLNLVGASLGTATIDNTGGTIEATAGSTVTHNTTNRGIVGGQLTGVGTHVIGNSNARFDTLTVDALVNITNTNRLDALGTIVNNNIIRVNTTGSSTYLQPVGTTIFTGNGAIELMGNNAWLYDQSNSNNASDHLINSASHTIRGVGNIGFSNNLEITNQGLIDANVAGGTLNVTPNESGMINTGIMRASNGGNLNLVGTSLGTSVIDNTGGIIEAAAGSTVTHNTTNRGIVGGQLTGAGTHLVGSSNARFDTLTVDALVNITNTNRLDALGTIVNNNIIRVNTTGSNTYLQPVGTTIFAGNGAIELMGNNAWLYDNSNTNSASDHLINGPTHTIRGVGNIGFSTTLQITNQGLIHANVSGGTLNVIPNAFGLDNPGTMRASNGGTMLLQGSNHGGTGTFEALDGSLLSMGASTVNNNVSAGGELTAGTWRAIDSGAGATLRMLNNSTALINTIGADAIVELSGANSALTVRSTNITLDSTLDNVQGTLNLRNGRVMTTTAGLTSQGGIVLDGATTRLAVSGDFHQTAGSMMLIDGATLQLQGGDNQFSGGLLAGNGTVDGSFTLGDAAVLSPGLSPGQIDINGNFTWDAGGLMAFDLGSDNLTSDFIQINGDFLRSGAGVWAFNFINNGMVEGNTYDLIGFTGTTNFDLANFSFTNLGGFDGSFAFGNGGQTLQFTLNAIPEPNMAGFIMLSVLGFNLFRRRTNKRL